MGKMSHPDMQKIQINGLLIPNYNQQDATFLHLFISTDARRVSGGSSAHHQEHINVHTASGIVNCNDRVKWIASKFVYQISG
jgi:hypothetical protein